MGKKHSLDLRSQDEVLYCAGEDLHMPRFFVSPEAVSSGTAVISGDDARHISRSLRMKTGESLTVCTPDGMEYGCTISDITADAVMLQVNSAAPSVNEPPYRATVYQSLVRGERMDTAIQKSVEFGATSIVPVATSRATVKLTPADGEKKRARWQRIAEEAAKQCGRGIIPTVELPVSFDRAIGDAAGTVLFCYEDEQTLHLRDAIASAEEKGEFSIFIGPEGGYSAQEASSAANAGAQTVSLGRRILRTESAAPFVLACLSFALEV